MRKYLKKTVHFSKNDTFCIDFEKNMAKKGHISLKRGWK
jgi:predicted Ser/Thr protein kinase